MRAKMSLQDSDASVGIRGLVERVESDLCLPETRIAHGALAAQFVLHLRRSIWGITELSVW
jgi:hypothetical protein